MKLLYWLSDRPNEDPATSKIELFKAIINSFQPLVIVKKSSILYLAVIIE